MLYLVFFGSAALALLIFVFFINDIFPDPGMRWTREEMRGLRRQSRIKPKPSR